MSNRIERVIGSVFGQTTIRRKEAADRDGSSGEQQKEQEAKDQDDGHERQPVDRQDVEKAMQDLRVSGNFNQTGMRLEMIGTAGELRVRLSHADGATVKVMTAEEFMKLRESSAGERALRGKILDQKF